jgi:hypothetical protein
MSGTLTGNVTVQTKEAGYSILDITLDEITFSKGAARTSRMTLSMQFTTRDGNTHNATVSYSCQFHANTRLQFAETSRSGIEYPYQLIQQDNVFKVADIYGDSTKTPLDETVYIDTDIGEAYTEAGGVVSSANALVSLPAKLPVLKSGANTITYDNTITQFKVVPRWWEV